MESQPNALHREWLFKIIETCFDDLKMQSKRLRCDSLIGSIIRKGENRTKLIQNTKPPLPTLIGWAGSFLRPERSGGRL